MTRQFISYVLIGIFNTTWGYALIFFLMYIAGLSPVMSNVITYSIGLFATYLLNRKITFKSKNKINKEFIRFLVVYVIAYAANLLALVTCIDIINIHAGVSQIIASIFYILASFTAMRLFVYAKNKQARHEVS